MGMGGCWWYGYNGGSNRATQLRADVRFTGTQFEIKNRDRTEWTDVRLQINGGLATSGYEFRLPSLAAGETIQIGALQFAKSDGTRFNPLQVKPQQFVIVARLDGEIESWAGGWP